MKPYIAQFINHTLCDVFSFHNNYAKMKLLTAIRFINQMEHTSCLQHNTASQQ